MWSNGVALASCEGDASAWVEERLASFPLEEW